MHKMLEIEYIREQTYSYLCFFSPSCLSRRKAFYYNTRNCKPFEKSRMSALGCLPT